MRPDTRYHILFAVTISVLFFSSACCAQQALPFYGEVTAGNINVRADSTVSSEAVCVLDKGSRVEVIAELYDWYKIRLPKNAPAYIKKNFLECVSYKPVVPTAQAAPAQPVVKECLTAKLLNDRVNVRLHPDTASKILGIVNKNDTVILSGESGEWYKIDPPLNTFGFISKQFVKQAAAVTIAIPAVNPSQAPLDALITLEGVVQPYGKFFNRPATHKLVAADNAIYLLKGDKNSLNALNYKKVSVTGTRAQISGQKYPAVEVKTLEIAK